MICKDSAEIITESFSFIRIHLDSLQYRCGPVLLHNDLHPRNIIVRDGCLEGVIDWECSQFGEADFDLTHLVHWCLIPPDGGGELRPFLASLLRHSRYPDTIPTLSARLAIYQIEHEIQQLIWNNGHGEKERCRRITAWLDGMIDGFLSDAGMKPGSR